ncbi:VWA domain-containing protein [Candidatus Pacearchaeota archaeon]|nr:VWA domain-containing protein [Candidatus Pacearchaeota archaeon]
MGESGKKDKKGKEAGQPKQHIPLQHVAYRADVNGAFARVECVQEFKNNAAKPVEAVYVFPVPDDASVTECEMAIGKKNVTAELKKRKEAREEYDKAVEAGHHASLLEQERPNIFTMNVGGIEPKEEIRVKVAYVQRIPWGVGGARFRIPLVVAPRFIPGVPIGKEGGGWAKDTDQVQDASKITPIVAEEGVSYDAGIEVSFSPGFRCKLSCPSHETIISEQTVAKGGTLKLKTGSIRTDRDFTLVYESLSQVPEIAVHAGRHENENFLLASVIPPGNVAPVASDIVLVLDCSGSMWGAKIAGLRLIAKKIVENLKNQKVGHRIGIQPFDSQPWAAHPVSDINEATGSFIDKLEARGGTELGAALMAAERLFSASSKPRVMLMVTDGDTESGKYWNGNGIRLIAVGIDTAVNDTLIKELTRRNNGVSEFVLPGEDFSAVSNRLAGYVSGPVLQDVSVKADGDVVGVSDVFQGWPATISARFKNKDFPACKLHITGKNPEGKEISWKLGEKGADKCDFAAQIWARDFIRENKDEKKQTDASLNYGVACAYTSFVAVSEKKVPGQKPERVEIPVNLPAGWVYEKVFGTGLTHRGITVGVASSVSRGVSRTMAAGPVDMLCSVEEISTGPEPANLLKGRIVSIKSGGFNFGATGIAEGMIAVLIAADKGKNEDAERIFKMLCKSLTLKLAKKLDETTRAKAYYFALRLAAYGYKIERKVMKYLSWKPSAKSTEALAWHYLALKEAGRTIPSTSAISVPSAGGNGYDYIMWKLGRGARPTDMIWCEVP